MTPITQDVWDRALGVLREVVGEDEYGAWLLPTTLEEYNEEANQVTLSVRSEFHHRWISRKYLEAIRSALHQVAGNEMRVQIVVQDGGGNAAMDTSPPDMETHFRTQQTDGTYRLGTPAPRGRGPEIRRHPHRSAQPTERARLNPRYTFEDFVVGESNRYAYAAAQSVADPSSQAFNPLFIYGQSGLGKTHLMQAIGHAFQAHNPSARILYVTSEHFINSFIESIRLKQSLDFKNRYRNVDVLLLDDVQFLMGKEHTQTELFHTFNVLFDAGKKIVLSSDRPPKDLSTLEDRLRSRFEWGVIADIAPPDLETRMAILRHKARKDGMKLPSDVVTYIAERVKSNIRELEGALKRIKVYAGLNDCPVTLSVVREVLSHLVLGHPDNRVAVEDIQRCVCEYFEITSSELQGSNRSKKFSQPRHLALYLCRELTDLSFPDIAQRFGGKDHTSVIYACRKIKKQIDQDSNMASIVGYLTKQIQRGQGS